MANYQSGYNMRSPYRGRTYCTSAPECGCQRESVMARDAEFSCENSCQKNDMGDFPIGMGYVPWQNWREIYELEKAFQAGTIFAELDKPFFGRRASKC